MSLVSMLAQLFAPNAHAIRYFDSHKEKWNYRKVGRPLSDPDIAKHISRSDPEFSLGAYVLRDLKNSRGHALIFDFDDHDSDSGPLITEIASKFSRILEEMGLPYFLFRSGGGNGFHFYLLFEESQPKSWLRAVGKHLVCEKLRLTEGTSGVKAGEVEIFPKSDRPGGENVIALPLARKSVALRREGDHFVEAPEPTEIPYCPVLTQIEDPGYGKSAPSGDARREFLQQLIGYTDRTAHAVLSLGDGAEKPKWQRLDEPLTPASLSNPDTTVGAYFPIDAKSDKAQVMVIGVREAEAISRALAGYAHFVVSSANGHGFYVWIVFNKPRRRDQLRKIAKDAIVAAGLQEFAILAPENGPVELPFSGESRFVSGFNDNGAIFGPIPSRMPVDQGRTPGPKQKTPDKDEAFACLVSAIEPADYDSWVKVGHLLIAAFGKDDPWAFERWSSWARTAPDGDTPDALQHKWEKDLADKPAYSPASFWLAAKDAGYVGALPFGKSEEKKFQSLDLIVGVPLFRSKEEASFATIGPRRHVEVRSRAFQHFVRLQTLDMGGDLMSAETLSAVVETIDAKCQEDTERFPVHLRVARHDDKGYLFLGDDARTVIEYGADGFRECAEPPVRFRLAPGSKPLPMPVAGTLKDLRALVNLDDENWALLLSWVVMTLVHPGRPTPICVLNGEHGSAKTTALKQVVAILDPKVGATAGPPKTEDDLIASAYSSHVVSFDNVSSFSALSDPLCRLATGGGLRKRQLFTDNNLAAYDVIRPV